VLAALAMAIVWGPAYILRGKKGLVAEPGGSFSASRGSVCQLANLRVKLGADGTAPCSCVQMFEIGFGCETVNFEIHLAGKLDIS
jgi:hypothetical protein